MLKNENTVKKEIYKIYTIRDLNDDSSIYIGSTKQKLSNRFSSHKCNHKTALYKYVENKYNGDWSSMYIELYEIVEVDNTELLHKREGEIIRLIGTINKRIAGRTNKENMKERWTNNPEFRIKQLERMRLYRLKKKEEEGKKKEEVAKGDDII